MFSSGHPFRADSPWARLFQSQPHTQEVHQLDLIGGKESRHLHNSGASFYPARREMTLGSGTHEVNSHISLIRFRRKNANSSLSFYHPHLSHSLLIFQQLGLHSLFIFAQCCLCISSVRCNDWSMHQTLSLPSHLGLDGRHCWYHHWRAHFISTVRHTRRG